LFFFFTLSGLIFNELITSVWTTYSGLLFYPFTNCVTPSTFKSAYNITTSVKSHMLFLINRSIKHLRMLHKILFCTGKKIMAQALKPVPWRNPPLNVGP